ncbi:MAG: META domain-containing protein [Methylobacteriaceae bacterium]|nr:META domain-containing protein [Methylobacteriaceae bacterium]MBV9218527.1 META domain-containing protein [Methylobacteriaceae bacterium]MBV9633870.1 META domain-containing protein [Methylobacteriaceae bacterium]MBV9705095.1 META domain-containing protein [Methylobacteriaceae bacterium]
MSKIARKSSVPIILALGCGALALVVVSASAQGPRRRGQEQPKQPMGDLLATPQKQFPLGTTWVLKAFNDKPIPFKEEVTFSIDSDYRGSGYSGCNTWSATVYPVKDQKLLVGPVALTHKQCDKSIMQFELQYLAALHVGPNWDLDGGDLVMNGQGGKLRFQRSL